MSLASVLQPLAGGRVAAQFVKHARGRGVEPARMLTFRTRYGIDGDVNASPSSPRQVLLLCDTLRVDLGVAPGALRENVLLTGIDPASLASGAVVHVGSAEIRVTFACEPCGFAVGVTGRSLRSLAGVRGHLGVVVASGTTTCYDMAWVEQERYQPMPEDRHERVGFVIDAIPAGRWLTFSDVVRAVGAPKACVRAMPRWLECLPGDTPTHRVLPASGEPRDELQHQQLVVEGTLDGATAPAGRRWPYEDLFYQPVRAAAAAAPVRRDLGLPNGLRFGSDNGRRTGEVARVQSPRSNL